MVSAGSPTLIVGATGYIGRFVAEANLDSRYLTYVLLRPCSPKNPEKSAIIDALKEKGALIIEGCVTDKHLITKKLKEKSIEVVISVTGGARILDQLPLVDAIKAAGNVKRFLPSEFGHDIDRTDPVEPGLSLYNEKRNVRRAIEAANIPYTYICCNSIAGWPYHDKIHPSTVTPPMDRFEIYGNGNIGAYFVAGEDIGKVTVLAARDSRTLNKTVHFRPTCNLISLNEMASLWEGKIKQTLPRIILTEKDLLAMAKENIIPRSIVAALSHDIFVNGCQTNYSIEGHTDVEASRLYPNHAFKTLDHCFNEYAASLH